MPDRVQVATSNLKIGADQSVTWANSDAANTQRVITFARPDQVLGTYKVVVYNPSTVTDLTVKAFTVETSLGGAFAFGAGRQCPLEFTRPGRIVPRPRPQAPTEPPEAPKAKAEPLKPAMPAGG